MKTHFKSFEIVINLLENDPSVSDEVIEKLEKIHDGLKGNAKKIFSAAKFVDYFVHDILDYTMLNKDSKNFVKDIKIQNIKESIQEIIDILQDKISFKSI